MTKKVAIDASVYREPASGVHLAVKHAVTSEVSGLNGKAAVEIYSGLNFSGAVNCPVPSWASRPAGRVLWQQFCLPGRLRKSGVEALHAQAYTLPLRSHLPTLLNVHDIIALEAPALCAPANVWQMQLLLPASIRRASKCIVPTRHVAERLMAVLGVPAAKIEIAPWGVDYECFSRPAETPRAVPERYFLFVGNLEPKKNLPLLLAAYSRAAQRSGCALVIAGRAAWKSGPVVQALRSWRGPGEVLWLGRVEDQDLPGLYQGAQALVMPSLHEGFGLPVLEAMAAGCPVLHSRQPALLEVAGGAGRSFPADDAEALQRLLEQIATEEALRTELRAAGQERARVLPWSRWGRQAAELLLSL
ncbi:MAG: glycosyltransferase family 4 protein [Oligosphaeraceae bacterium]|nr:glycosyltransferase family 4 protein [Oligosphaeraceae bacterium]